MNILRAIWRDFERWTAMFLIAFLSVVLFLEVLFRYVFYLSLGWIGEVSGIAFVWFIYLSVSYVTGRGGHIRVEILDRLVSQKWLWRTDLAMDLLWLGFTALLAVYGVKLVLSVLEYPFHTPMLDISMAVPYSIVPIAFGLMTIRLALDLGRRIKTGPGKAGGEGGS